MYSTEALERGIEDIEKNIKVFETQIDKERQRIEEYRGMIKVLEDKETEEKIARALEQSMSVH
jgi:chaperonin cofactor prefoldin